MDETLPMFQRMRAVFALRNAGGKRAIDALARVFEDPSALLRHEVAYVMGQMGDAHALPVLTRVLATESEHVMVRHEAAEAMGAIGDEAARPALQRFCDDPHPEVAQSCVVALDLMDWVNSKELEYSEW
jgi:deoxyhypusine monooxygenase